MQVSGIPSGTPARTTAPLTLPVSEWLKVSRFHPLGQAETLRLVLQLTRQAMDAYRRGEGPRPVVVFDLDDTLFVSHQPRTHRILREWLAARPALDTGIARALAAVNERDIPYGGVKPTFQKAARLELGDPKVAAALVDFETFWKARFLSNAYVIHDPRQPGGVDYARAIFAMGAGIAYLTGRDAPNMGEGTRIAIRNSGLPEPSDRVQLYLKPRADMDDAEFKRSVRAAIAASGKVVATFDNAPANVVVLSKSFPDAAHVFVDTIYDSAPVEVRDGLYRVKGFTI
ncbi:MAG TPA: hypothetical protein VLC93_12220 [Myxococcota bacterium]|nr:hypothetical protein [Myxococcota bacterium]